MKGSVCAVYLIVGLESGLKGVLTQLKGHLVAPQMHIRRQEGGAGTAGAA